MPITLKITEEPSKDGNGKPSTIFYVREHPVRPGHSIQATALTQSGAEWQKDQIEQSIARTEARQATD